MHAREERWSMGLAVTVSHAGAFSRIAAQHNWTKVRVSTSCPPNTKERPRRLLLRLINLRALQRNPLMPNNINNQIPIMKSLLILSPQHMQMRRALVLGSSHIKVHIQSLRAHPISLRSRSDGSIPPPFVPCRLAECPDLGAFAEDVGYANVTPDAVDGSVEVGG